MEITSKVFEEDGEKRELVLTMTASAEEVDSAITAFFKDYGRREVPGFRKGKAPRSVLEKVAGGHDAAFGGVAETLINTLSFGVIDDADIMFLGEPSFNVDTLPEDGKPFTFTVSGAVPPVVTLSDYGPVSIEMPPDEATDAEVDEHIENLRDYYHTFENIDDPDYAAQMGDYVNVEMTCTRANTGAIQGLTDVTRMIGLGKGTMPESFDEKMVGAKAGDTIEFDFEVGEREDRPEFGDGNLHAVVTVKNIRKCIIPELDDAFAQKLGSENVETLRGAAKMALDADKRKILPDMMIQRCMEQLLARIEGEVPEYFVQVIKEDVSREFMQSLEKSGTSLQEWMMQNDVQKEQMQNEINTEAARRAALDVAIEALFAKLDMEVTDEEIDKTLAKEKDAAAVRASWEEAQRMADLRKLVRQDMVTRWLVKTADVTVVE